MNALNIILKVIYYLFLLVFIPSCSCPETFYINHAHSNELSKISPYQKGQTYVFQSNKNSVLEYELKVLNRDVVQREFTRIQNYPNDPNAYGCDKDYPEHVYTSSFDEILLEFDAIQENDKNQNYLSLMIGTQFDQNIPELLIHNNQLNTEMHLEIDPIFHYLFQIKVMEVSSNIGLESIPIKSINIAGNEYSNVYEFDSLQTLEDMYFNQVLYSFEHGFLRFITVYNDTLDLISN